MRRSTYILEDECYWIRFLVDRNESGTFSYGQLYRGKVGVPRLVRHGALKYNGDGSYSLTNLGINEIYAGEKVPSYLRED